MKDIIPLVFDEIKKHIPEDYLNGKKSNFYDEKLFSINGIIYSIEHINYSTLEFYHVKLNSESLITISRRPPEVGRDIYKVNVDYFMQRDNDTMYKIDQSIVYRKQYYPSVLNDKSAMFNLSLIFNDEEYAVLQELSKMDLRIMFCYYQFY